MKKKMFKREEEALLKKKYGKKYFHKNLERLETECESVENSKDKLTISDIIKKGSMRRVNSS